MNNTRYNQEMEHLFVLVNAFSLLTGAATLASIAVTYMQHPTIGDRLMFTFFLSFSYLMIVSSVFAYLFINVRYTQSLEKLFAMLIITGMAAVEYTLPRFRFHQAGFSPGPGIVFLIRISIAVTCILSVFCWFLSPVLETYFIVFPFVPFTIVITLSITADFMKNHVNKAGQGSAELPASVKLSGRLDWKGLVTVALYVPLVAFAAWEMHYLSVRENYTVYMPLSLPLAYLATCGVFLRIHKGQSKAKTVHLQEKTPFLYPGTVQEFGLTRREAEMAGYILGGMSNKEIAWTLGLSEITVRNHIYNLYQKLGINKRMDLLRIIQPY